MNQIIQNINQAQKITIIQAENPDGDSLGTALGLEEILGNLGKEIKLYCPVEIPKYLRYFSGWSRVEDNLWRSDLYIIVDTTSSILLSKVLENPLNKSLLENSKVVVIDHHTDTKPDLPFQYDLILEEASSTAEIVLELSEKAGWEIPSLGAENLLGALLSDTLGFSTQNTSAKSFFNAGKLAELGANSSKIDIARREFSKKQPEILSYKGELLQRINYFLDGKLAVIHIPWEEIKLYSDKYNPSILVIDEMRLVEGVEACVAIKTYPDGKLTGKIRTNSNIAADIAGYFGGGGHAYAAGFRIYENFENTLSELITACDKIFKEK